MELDTCRTRQVRSGQAIENYSIEEIDPSRMFGFSDLSLDFYKVGRNSSGYVVSLSKIILEPEETLIGQSQIIDLAKRRFLYQSS